MTKHQDRQPRKQQQKRPQFFHRNDQRVCATRITTHVELSSEGICCLLAVAKAMFDFSFLNHCSIICSPCLTDENVGSVAASGTQLQCGHPARVGSSGADPLHQLVKAQLSGQHSLLGNMEQDIHANTASSQFQPMAL